MLGHVTVPMVMRTTTNVSGADQQQWGPSTNTYTVDAIGRAGVMTSRRHYHQQQQHLNVSVIEEELSTVSTPLMSTTASSNGSGISTLTRNCGTLNNPRESAV